MRPMRWTRRKSPYTKAYRALVSSLAPSVRPRCHEAYSAHEWLFRKAAPSARVGWTSFHSLTSTYWRALISRLACATASSFTAYEAMPHLGTARRRFRRTAPGVEAECHRHGGHDEHQPGDRPHHRHDGQGLQHHLVHGGMPLQRPAPGDVHRGRGAGGRFGAGGVLPACPGRDPLGSRSLPNVARQSLATAAVSSVAPILLQYWPVCACLESRRVPNPVKPAA